jgi:hypothetical protein
MEISIVVNGKGFPAELICVGQEKKMAKGTASLFPVGTTKTARLYISNEAYREISIALKREKENLDAANQ